MTTPTCRWITANHARIIPGRHTDDCRGIIDFRGEADYTECSGCLPCTEPHCRVCNRTHTNGTCGECTATTREALHEIGRMTDSLPEEVESRGIDGEAMMLLGPATNPERWARTQESAAAGRIPEDWSEIPTRRLPDGTEQRIDEQHPLFVLGTWDMTWRIILDHDQPDENELTLATALTYLDTQLTYMAGHPASRFDEFNRDVRRCAAHLESVLHDGEQHDRGAPCMADGTPLERTWGKDERSDGWICPKCRRTSTEAQYRFAVAHLHRDTAKWLSDRDIETRTGIKAGTVRSWARSEHVARKIDAGRTLYSVDDVETHAREKGMIREGA